ncbi:MAG TPA: NTP transferase domain-containing protein [Candidatus Limnocylindrales bacterium]|nr:NTP transferase domain-containing protein [Candidatus Limnocylindrales bacterium]
MADRVVVLVLAAGIGSRFGGGKLLAMVGGKPLLQHVLDRVAEAGIGEVVVVLGADADAIERAITWRAERRVRNPDPVRGLASSLHVGMAALDPGVDAALILLGDQPLVSTETIRALLDAPIDPARSVVVPVYADGSGRNPVLLRRGAFELAREAVGDRGLGPVLGARSELVLEIAVEGDNPDVDTPEDLAKVLEADWAARVRANREQVERIREVPDGADFYAPVQSLFRADPTRTDDPVLLALLDLVRPGETWLDVGAGAGRFALPIARALDPSGGSVIAFDTSPSMLEGLRDIAEDYAIENVRTVEGRWPPTDPARYESDVVLIAHVGYDIELIGPFVDAMERAARRLCVAVLMERQPSSIADAFWPPVHGETRVPLPALTDFKALLKARGRTPTVTMQERAPRRFESRDELIGFLRRQLWIADGGEKERRFRKASETLVVEEDGRFGLVDQQPLPVGIVTWSPDRR